MPFSTALRAKLLPILDFLIVVTTGIVALWLRNRSIEIDDRYLMSILLTGFVTAYVFHSSRVYVSVDTTLFAQLKRLIVPLLIVLLLVALIGFLTKLGGHFSRIWAVLWFALLISFLIGSRMALAGLTKHAGIQNLLSRQMIILAPSDQIDELKQQIDNELEPWLSVSAAFALDSDESASPIDECLHWSRRQRIDDVLFVPPRSWSDDMNDRALRLLQQIPANLHYGPLKLLSTFSGAQRANIGSLGVLNLSREPLDAFQRGLKGAVDWLLALILLACAAPLMLLIALGIKLESRGPVLFRQARYGFQREVFMVYKFRTMVVHSEPDDAITQASKGDPRVTRFGAFLRRFSLDELPQLFNVLNGSMALSGPRPHALSHDDHFAEQIDRYLGRHRVKPGITGWAQANGYRGEIHSEADMQKRLDHDLYYVENWTLMLDLEILLRTALIVITQRNAY